MQNFWDLGLRLDRERLSWGSLSPRTNPIGNMRTGEVYDGLEEASPTLTITLQGRFYINFPINSATTIINSPMIIL